MPRMAVRWVVVACVRNSILGVKLRAADANVLCIPFVGSTPKCCTFPATPGRIVGRGILAKVLILKALRNTLYAFLDVERNWQG
jgi:hypothetical protein